ncbi:hypothetical protein BH10ACT1_BH10ACT1_02180 [soil metagenome]
MTANSARPEALRAYGHKLERGGDAIQEAIARVEAAGAAFGRSCPDGGPVAVPLPLTRRTAEGLRSLGRRIASVADAFEEADRTGGKVATPSDRGLADAILADHPSLACWELLGPRARELAASTASALRRAAERDEVHLDEIRAGVPAHLWTDPAFCRAVIQHLGAERLTVLVDAVGRDRAQGRGLPLVGPDADLAMLGNLFARGSSDEAGDPTATTTGMLAEPGGRTAVRLLRSTSSIPLPLETLRAVAVATVVLSSTAGGATDGSAVYLDGTGIDQSNEAILREVARSPDLSAWLITGPIEGSPRAGRLRNIVAGSARTAQAGLAEMLDVAFAHPSLNPTVVSADELRAVEGLIGGMDAIVHDDMRLEAVRRPLAETAGRILQAHRPALMLLETTTIPVSDLSAAERRSLARRRKELRSAIQHLGEFPVAFASVGQSVMDARQSGLDAAVAGRGLSGVAAAGQLHQVVAEGAKLADVPLRPYDDAIVIASGLVKLTVKAFAPEASTAAGPGITLGGDVLSDWAALPAGNAVERLERIARGQRDMVLSVALHPPAGTHVVWSGSGISGTRELASLGSGPADRDRLNTWLAAQPGPVQDRVKDLARAYATGS